LAEEITAKNLKRNEPGGQVCDILFQNKTLSVQDYFGQGAFGSNDQKQ